MDLTGVLRLDSVGSEAGDVLRLASYRYERAEYGWVIAVSWHLAHKSVRIQLDELFIWQLPGAMFLTKSLFRSYGVELERHYGYRLEFRAADPDELAMWLWLAYELLWDARLETLDGQPLITFSHDEVLEVHEGTVLAALGDGLS